MSLAFLLLVLHVSSGHRIVTVQSRAGKLFNECQLETVNLIGGSIRLWVGEKLTTVKATDVAAIHVSDLEKGPLVWIDDSLLRQAA